MCGNIGKLTQMYLVTPLLRFTQFVLYKSLVLPIYLGWNQENQYFDTKGVLVEMLATIFYIVVFVR